MSKKKDYIIAAILTLIMTFIEMSALPMVLFCKIEIADVQPIYIALILNFLIAFCICFIFRKAILKDWVFGLTSNEYPMMALITCLVAYCGLGVYGISRLKKTN